MNARHSNRTERRERVTTGDMELPEPRRPHANLVFQFALLLLLARLLPSARLTK